MTFVSYIYSSRHIVMSVRLSRPLLKGDTAHVVMTAHGPFIEREMLVATSGPRVFLDAQLVVDSCRPCTEARDIV